MSRCKFNVNPTKIINLFLRFHQQGEECFVIYKVGVSDEILDIISHNYRLFIDLLAIDVFVIKPQRTRLIICMVRRYKRTFTVGSKSKVAASNENIRKFLCCIQLLEKPFARLKFAVHLDLIGRL